MKVEVEDVAAVAIVVGLVVMVVAVLTGWVR